MVDALICPRATMRKSRGAGGGQERTRARCQDCRARLITLTQSSLSLHKHTRKSRKDSGLHQRLNERTAVVSVWTAGGVREQ